MNYCKLSDFIFQRFVLPQGVDEKYKNIYSYGLEVVLSSLINMMVLFILSAVLNIFTEMLCFLLTFVPLRIFGRGAHASSHSKCLILFTSIMLASIAAGTMISETGIYQPIMLLGVGCCMFFQYRYSTDKQRKLRYNNQHLIIFTFPWIICLMACIVLFVPIEPKYAVISVFGIYIQSISLLIKKNKGE